MRTFANDTLSQVKGIWARLDTSQRTVVSAVLLATVAGLGGIVWFAGQPSYETVYTARSNDDITKIRQALDKNNISYVPGPNGSFQVERSKVSLAQLAIQEEGLMATGSPSVGGGMSLIEDAETKAWKLDAASRAQVVAAIQALDGVAQATVTASRPRRQAAFRDRDADQRPSATIALRLKANASFEQLARAAAKLASSQLMVPEQNINVISAAGNQSYRFDPDRDAGGGSSEFLSLQNKMGDERTQAAQARLDQLWPGKTNVSVTVELDPSWEVRSEKVVPTEALVRSEKVKKDNTDSSAGKTPEDGKNTSKNETRDREFVTDIGERRSGKMMPDIKRMTVAVIYDRSLVKTGFDDKELVKAVKSIVGWDPARDKEESFSTLVGEFAPVDLGPTVTSGPGFADIALQWGPTVGQIVGVIVVVMFLRGLFRSSKSSTTSGSPGGEAPRLSAAEEKLSPEEKHKRMRAEIEKSIADDPATLAKLLETWLTEQKA